MSIFKDGKHFTKGEMKALKIKSYIVRNKILLILLCMIGIAAVSYGMLKDNDLIFIIGLFLIFGGYLLFRKRIKESIREKS